MIFATDSTSWKVKKVDGKNKHIHIVGRRRQYDFSTGLESWYAYHMHERGVGEHSSPKWQEIHRYGGFEAPPDLWARKESTKKNSIGSEIARMLSQKCQQKCNDSTNERKRNAKQYQDALLKQFHQGTRCAHSPRACFQGAFAQRSRVLEMPVSSFGALLPILFEFMKNIGKT